MAMLNEILGAAARYNAQLTRKFGLTGGAPSPQLTPEIAPVYSVPSGVEDRLTAGVTMASAYISSGPSAAKRTVCQLSNPAGSNILIVCEHIEGYTGTADTIGCSIIYLTPLAAAAGAGTVSCRDTRVGLSGSYTREPVGRVTADDGPPTIGAPNVFFKYAAANTQFQYDYPIVLAPGWSVQVHHSTVNLGLQVDFVWYEVPLAAGERGPF